MWEQCGRELLELINPDKCVKKLFLLNAADNFRLLIKGCAQALLFRGDLLAGKAVLLGPLRHTG